MEHHAPDLNNTLNIENEQQNKLIDSGVSDMLRNVVFTALDEYFNHFDCSVNMLLTDAPGIRQLNREHRGVDSKTDVLSFPMLEFIEAGIPEELTSADRDMETGLLDLGDIAISVEKAEEQAKDFGHTFERELAFLALHGTLHLIGFDHVDAHDEADMLTAQDKILNSLGYVR